MKSAQIGLPSPLTIVLVPTQIISPTAAKMRLNENTGKKTLLPVFVFRSHVKLISKSPSKAVSTDRILLVPYDRRHVLQYHAWMEDPVSLALYPYLLFLLGPPLPLPKAHRPCPRQLT